MKPSLQFRLSQHLTLTPQLQQSIRLLQLSTVELNQEIERLIMDNPVLEREDVHDEHEAAPAAAAAPLAPAAGSSSEAPRDHDHDWPVEVAVNWRAGGDDEDESDRSAATADTPTLRE